jgi:cobalt-zinc-cadmium efflux system protein
MHSQPHAAHAGSAHTGEASAGLRMAFFLNLIFTLIEIGGGLWTNSIAVLSDAVHDAGDCLSVGVAWYLEHRSNSRPSALFTYGYRRLSVLGGMFTGLVLLAGVVAVLTRAIGRLANPEPVNAPGMIALGVLGVVVNGAALLRLRRGAGLNAGIMSWHFLEDTLGWAAILVGSVVLMVWDVPIVDPILSIGISLFVLWNVGRNLRKVLLVFLQTAPAGFDVDAFRQAARRIPQIVSTHHTHSWSIDGESHVFSTHLVLRRETSADEVPVIKQWVLDLLSPHRFEHVTIETERQGEPCSAGHAGGEPHAGGR